MKPLCVLLVGCLSLGLASCQKKEGGSEVPSLAGKWRISANMPGFSFPDEKPGSSKETLELFPNGTLALGKMKGNYQITGTVIQFNVNRLSQRVPGQGDQPVAGFEMSIGEWQPDTKTIAWEGRIWSRAE